MFNEVTNAWNLLITLAIGLATKSIAIQNNALNALATIALNNLTNWSALMNEKAPPYRSIPPHPPLNRGGSNEATLIDKTGVRATYEPAEKPVRPWVLNDPAAVEFDRNILSRAFVRFSA